MPDALRTTPARKGIPLGQFDQRIADHLTQRRVTVVQQRPHLGDILQHPLPSHVDQCLGDQCPHVGIRRRRQLFDERHHQLWIDLTELLQRQSLHGGHRIVGELDEQLFGLRSSMAGEHLDGDQPTGQRTGRQVLCELPGGGELTGICQLSQGSGSCDPQSRGGVGIDRQVL